MLCVTYQETVVVQIEHRMGKNEFYLREKSSTEKRKNWAEQEDMSSWFELLPRLRNELFFKSLTEKSELS